jgi:50S ribosomal protein L16 3-hydroxylase
VRRPETFLGGLSPGEFLSQHWQKQPLLVRGALPGYTPPLSPDELAGLALSEQVESRLVQERSGTFELERGPFDEATFAGLPESHYTLLVQDLDQHVPEVGELFELLDFLPSYRLDDVMASFAAPSGSVGPHFDQYDVFLLQVRGRRRWQIARAYDPAKLRDDTELCVLSEFQSEQEWVLDPGDMLYLPPRVAHYGVAVDACMTFSLGCRAPSVAEIVAHFAQAVVEQASEGERYEDPDLLPPGDRDCLDPAAVARVGRLLAERLSFDERALAQNLASLLTRPKALFAPEEHERLGTRSAARAVTSATGFVRRTGSRWLVCPLGDSLHLFVDGEGLAVPEGAEQMARELCRERVLSAQRVRDLRAQAACVSLLVELVARGALEPDGAG